MPQYQIAVIVGSLRKDSHNRKLASALARLAPAEFSFKEVSIGDLPLYNQDDDANQADSVKRFKAEIKAAHGVLFVTPEYNRSIPGVLKNAIDHGTRPPGQSCWPGKPAGIVGTSPGAIATAAAQQHLRNVLSIIDTRTMTVPEAYVQTKDGLYDEAGNIGEASLKVLQAWIDRFCAWVKQHQPAA